MAMSAVKCLTSTSACAAIPTNDTMSLGVVLHYLLQLFIDFVVYLAAGCNNWYYQRYEVITK